MPVSDFSRRAVLAAAAALGALPAFAQAKPRVGIIGAGRIGGTLARLWAEAGYPVMLSARDLDAVKKQAAQIGHGAQAGTSAEAAAFGHVVLISVPFGALPQIGKDYAVQLKGKVVLDTCNPYVSRDGDMAKEALEKGTGVTDPIYLPGTKLVRAFNQISAAQLASEAHRAGEQIAVPLAADDPAALAIAKQLVTDAGFEPVVVGGLASARSFDPGAAAYHTMTAKQLRETLGLKP